ncbi:unnamed protein product [Vitrella brassicaformis CCMP3155]|uniref:Uncharacterized protein n=2 Tax=Vitrella brassicaformis TaxID=1169539 RepID=A0A0G4GII9_VITBC|nr:unnamed protein product [Vitrella brassicaformis CCMP3155]|eukprot:CEM29651.1 unnamed protein product [Vitrella brassicaformis CCMP3155]
MTTQQRVRRAAASRHCYLLPHCSKAMLASALQNGVHHGGGNGEEITSCGSCQYKQQRIQDLQDEVLRLSNAYHNLTIQSVFTTPTASAAVAPPSMSVAVAVPPRASKLGLSRAATSVNADVDRASAIPAASVGCGVCAGGETASFSAGSGGEVDNDNEQEEQGFHGIIEDGMGMTMSMGGGTDVDGGKQGDGDAKETEREHEDDTYETVEEAVDTIRRLRAEMETMRGRLQYLERRETERSQEKRRQEKKLSSLLQAFAETVNISAWYCDTEDQATTYCHHSSKVYEALTGRSMPNDENTIQSFEDSLQYFQEPGRGELQMAWNKLRTEGCGYTLELGLERPDGQVRWFKCAGRMEKEGSNHHEAGLMWGFMMDTTEERKREGEKERFRGRLQRLADVTFDGWGLGDLQERVLIECSPSLNVLFGRRLEGTPIEQTLPSTVIQRIAADGYGRHLPVRLRRSDGEVFVAELNALVDSDDPALVFFAVRVVEDESTSPTPTLGPPPPLSIRSARTAVRGSRTSNSSNSSSNTNRQRPPQPPQQRAGSLGNHQPSPSPPPPPTRQETPPSPTAALPPLQAKRREGDSKPTRATGLAVVTGRRVLKESPSPSPSRGSRSPLEIARADLPAVLEEKKDDEAGDDVAVSPSPVRAAARPPSPLPSASFPFPAPAPSSTSADATNTAVSPTSTAAPVVLDGANEPPPNVSPVNGIPPSAGPAEQPNHRHQSRPLTLAPRYPSLCGSDKGDRGELSSPPPPVSPAHQELKGDRASFMLSPTSDDMIKNGVGVGVGGSNPQVRFGGPSSRPRAVPGAQTSFLARLAQASSAEATQAGGAVSMAVNGTSTGLSLAFPPPLPHQASRGCSQSPSSQANKRAEPDVVDTHPSPPHPHKGRGGLPNGPSYGVGGLMDAERTEEILAQGTASSPVRLEPFLREFQLLAGVVFDGWAVGDLQEGVIVNASPGLNTLFRRAVEGTQMAELFPPSVLTTIRSTGCARHLLVDLTRGDGTRLVADVNGVIDPDSMGSVFLTVSDLTDTYQDSHHQLHLNTAVTASSTSSVDRTHGGLTGVAGSGQPANMLSASAACPAIDEEERLSESVHSPRERERQMSTNTNASSSNNNQSTNVRPPRSFNNRDVLHLYFNELGDLYLKVKDRQPTASSPGPSSQASGSRSLRPPAGRRSRRFRGGSLSSRSSSGGASTGSSASSSLPTIFENVHEHDGEDGETNEHQKHHPAAKRHHHNHGLRPRGASAGAAAAAASSGGNGRHPEASSSFRDVGGGGKG